MPNLHQNILETIGHTPVVRVAKLEPPGRRVYVKVEAANPMGSVKDRLALGVIEAAEASGELRPGQTVIEATSGNTGIGLAMVCARKGYPLVVTMAENFSVERRKLMRFLGAKVVLTPASLKGSGMVDKATELAEANGWFLCRQFENEANADMHSRTTAREILDDFEGERLDYWVTGYGTGGTLKGVARVLKAERPEIKIAVCEPDNSPLLGSGAPQARNADGTPAESHSSFRPHLMQGWTPDFIPKLAGDSVAQALIDEVAPIPGTRALEMARALATSEGILCGITSGATLAGAIEVAKRAPEGSTVLCMLPDTGERYLSTVLFENVATEMTDVEQEISRSTPSARFDISAPPPAASEDAPAIITPAAEAFISKTIADTDRPVTMFALEWCEFCWSVRKFFDHVGIPYATVDLDSAENQADDWGGQVRAALTDRTGIKTIPQIFIGGELVGGCTEAFDAFKAGGLQTLLDRGGVEFDKTQRPDPYDFLPTWLHPR